MAGEQNTDQEMRNLEKSLQRLMPSTESIDELVQMGRTHAMQFHEKMTELVNHRRRFLDELRAGKPSLCNREDAEDYLPDSNVKEDEILPSLPSEGLPALIALKTSLGDKMEQTYIKIFSTTVYVGSGDPFEYDVLEEMLNYRTKAQTLDKLFVVQEMIIYELINGRKFPGTMDEFKETPTKLLYPLK